MSKQQIPIDFVAGAHGHFLEYMLNRFFHTADIDFDPFTKLGTSHQSNRRYEVSRLFKARHWFQVAKDELINAPCIISIQFSQEDLLPLSSVSLLRTNDMAIDNDELEVDTYNKLNNEYYSGTLDELQKAYPFLNLSPTNPSVPRSVLREFFKFGFSNPDINGYWRRQQEMVYPDNVPVFVFEFSSLYDQQRFVQQLKELEKFLKSDFDFCNRFYQLHQEFLQFQIYRNHKKDCDQIISAIKENREVEIPKLTMLQESYINGCLENIYQKEMPFHQEKYFTNTKDVLNYLKTSAPLL